MSTVPEERPSSKPRALVVDDSQIARYVLSDMLERVGLTVAVADSAELGLQTLREAGTDPNFDVVFMDYLLPGIDGLEAVRRLRARESTRDIPVIMYTSEEGLEFRKRAEDAGANDVFVKTARQDKLQEILLGLGLVSSDSLQRESGGNVIPMHGSPAGRAATGAADPTGMKMLARSLEAHHAALRSDLLAEFAILERHEEKMRSELASRVNLVARYTVAQLQKTAEESRKDRAAERQETARRTSAQVAMFALAVVLTLGLGWRAVERYADLDAQLAATTATLEEQRLTIEALRADVLAANQATVLAADVGTPEPAFPATVEFSGEPVSVAAPEPASAASALVDEMQSMGIMGRIQIETDAGTFCVRAAQDGYRIEGGNVAFSECESLPLAGQTTP